MSPGCAGVMSIGPWQSIGRFQALRRSRALFELSTPYPGDTFTVNVGALSNRPEAPFSTRHAASLRAIYDLAAPEASVWVQSTGQVGNPAVRAVRVDAAGLARCALPPDAAGSGNGSRTSH